MVRSQLVSLIRQVGTEADAGSDAALLARFADSADESAFTELVRRYARLVWGQCRNLLASEADADDAFQATFLALAKSAGAIRLTDRLGPWLHAVAYRICLTARRAAARRTRREQKAARPDAAQPLADSAWERAAATVHEEVSRLPDSLRVPFVLCYLEGKSPTAAAAQLGLKWGTFSTRLGRAKQQLLAKLATRGIGAAVALAVVGTAGSAPAAVVEQAIAFGRHPAHASPAVLTLLHGVRPMSNHLAKLVVGLALAAAVGLSLLFVPSNARPIEPELTAAPVPKDTPEVKGKRLDDLWKLLISPDEAVSSRALLEMSARPSKEVVSFLAEKLQPLKLAEDRAKQLVADLGEDDVKAKAAFEELRYFDPRLVLPVADMLKDLPDGEHRQRLASLLAGGDIESYAGCNIKFESKAVLEQRIGEGAIANFSIEDTRKQRAGGNARYSVGVAETVEEISKYRYSPQWGRAVRGVMLLEHFGSPAAVKALEVMATGHDDASPTTAAKEALARLKKK